MTSHWTITLPAPAKHPTRSVPSTIVSRCLTNQPTNQDRSDVDMLLGANSMSQLTLAEGKEEEALSQQKRRRDTASTLASPPAGPVTSPRQKKSPSRPPRKKVSVVINVPRKISAAASSGNVESAATASGAHGGSTVRERARPRGSKTSRARGGIGRMPR